MMLGPEDLDRFDRHWAVGERRISISDWRGAAEAFRACLAIDPEHAAAHAFLALSSAALKDKSTWAEATRSAMALAPEDPQILAVLARAAQEAEVYQDVLRLARKIQEIAPENAEGHIARANGQIHYENFEAALASAAKAREIAPDEPTVYAVAAVALLSLGRRDQALGAARAALRLGPDAFSPHSVAGVCEVLSGSLRAAREHLASMARQNPADPAVATLAALIRARATWWLGPWWWGYRTLCYGRPWVAWPGALVGGTVTAMAAPPLFALGLGYVLLGRIAVARLSRVEVQAALRDDY
ncbi:MAG: hypothetical protein AAFV96_04840 [Pseudomonadota bacterium]